MTKNQYISNIFLRPKRDESHRVILNLKQLNSDIEHFHLKMETLQTALSCVSPNCWFASCDLKEAYYSLNVDSYYRKFLRFDWSDVLYEYTCLPNGLITAPTIFTKVLKIVFSQLRNKGHVNVAYIDDSLLVSNTFSECEKNISDTTYLLDYLGFTIHPDKSVLKPTQIITLLEFIIDSRNMCVRLTEERANNIVEMASDFIKKRCVTIRQFAQVIGKLVAAEPGVEFATLYKKSLEISKDKSVKRE